MKDADQQLYKLFFKNDSSAVKEVVATFRKELVLFVNSYLHDLNQAEDIISDTFVKIIIKKPKLKDKKNFRTYVYKTAKNLTIDYLKHKKREVNFCENYQATFDEDLIETEEKNKLLSAISELKKEYRLIIYLRYYRDFSIQEISKVIKKNTKYVYNVLNRAKNQLKIKLKEVE